MPNETDPIAQELQDVGVPESPATWENVAVGKAKEIIGHALGDEERADEGEQQDDIAHEVRNEYRREHP
jgi:uncharacterized protein YjbJ (UPF0337 family)